MDVAAHALHDYFQALFQWHIAHTTDQAPPNGQTALSFLVGGYDRNSRVGQLYEIAVPGGVALRSDTNNPGTRWLGQWDVIARIINGFDIRLKTLPFYIEIPST